MNFDEWWEHNAGLTETEGVHNVSHAAYDAGVSAERERCLSLCRQVASLPHAKSPVAWTTAAGYLAEQIRKGE